MSVILRHSAFVLGLSLLAAVAAHATTVSGTATFADTTSNNNLTVNGTFNGTNCSTHCSFTEALTLNGASYTDSDFLTLGTNLSGGGNQSKTDNISVSFNITNPAGGSGSIGGSATEIQTVSYFGFFNYNTTDTASVSWSGPASILLSNGDTLHISLASTNLSSSDCGCDDSDNCGNVAATFSLTAPVPTAATPEPASIALLGTGLASAAGLVRRRSRR